MQILEHLNMSKYEFYLYVLLAFMSSYQFFYHQQLFHRMRMTHHKINKCLGKVVGKGSIHCFKVIQGQSMQPLLVLLGILFFHPQQTQQVCLLDPVLMFLLNLFLPHFGY